MKYLNLDNYNFEHNGCKIEFLRNITNSDITILIKKGSLRKVIELRAKFQRQVNKNLILDAKEYMPFAYEVDDDIKAIKELITRGEIELQ